MTWNYLQLELVPADALIRPMIGPGALTREQAHHEVLGILTRLAKVQPAARKLVTEWTAGAKDDTVYAGPFTWAIYQSDDPVQGARDWVDGYVATLRDAGVHVGIAW